MIEKIQVTRFDNDLATKTLEAINKINELIDMTNRLHIEINNHDCRLLSIESQIWDDNEKKAEPADPFAEQRKWIGNLCRFWDFDKTHASYSVLKEINEYSEQPYKKTNELVYKHCEPVKPDDSIIYKGE